MVIKTNRLLKRCITYQLSLALSNGLLVTIGNVWVLMGTIMVLNWVLLVGGMGNNSAQINTGIRPKTIKVVCNGFILIIHVF